MKIVAICLILILGGFGLGWARRQQVVDLRRKNSELRETLAEIESCKQAVAAADPTPVDTNHLARLRQDWSELMQLRSQVGRLRKLARVDGPHLQRQTERILAQVEREQRLGPQLLEDRATRLHSSLVTNYLNFAIWHPLMRMAQEHEGRFPSSFAEAEQWITVAPEVSHWRSRRHWEPQQLDPAEADLIGRSFSVSRDDFEIVPSAQPLTLTGPAAPLVRERQARPKPGGLWVRAYAFTDGRIEEVLSDRVSSTQ